MSSAPQLKGCDARCSGSTSSWHGRLAPAIVSAWARRPCHVSTQCLDSHGCAACIASDVEQLLPQISAIRRVAPQVESRDALLAIASQDHAAHARDAAENQVFRTVSEIIPAGLGE